MMVNTLIACVHPFLEQKNKTCNPEYSLNTCVVHTATDELPISVLSEKGSLCVYMSKKSLDLTVCEYVLIIPFIRAYVFLLNQCNSWLGILQTELVQFLCSTVVTPLA